MHSGRQQPECHFQPIKYQETQNFPAERKFIGAGGLLNSSRT